MTIIRVDFQQVVARTYYTDEYNTYYYYNHRRDFTVTQTHDFCIINIYKIGPV